VVATGAFPCFDGLDLIGRVLFLRTVLLREARAVGLGARLRCLVVGRDSGRVHVSLQAAEVRLR